MASKQQEGKKKQARRSAFLFGGNCLGMLLVMAAILFGGMYWLDSYTRHGESIEVPDVRGKRPTDAIYALEMLDLAGVVYDSSYYDSTYMIGTIKAQDPIPGRHVKSGHEIRLSVNPRPVAAIPDLAGNSSYREAKQMLLSYGFKARNITVVKVPHQYDDWVVAIKCNGEELPAGTIVPLSSRITIEVGDGSLSNGMSEEEIVDDFQDDAEDLFE